MSDMPDNPVWRQLGEMLRRTREDLGVRYAGRGGLTLFAEERGLNRRVAWDIENGRRDNYTRAMLRDIEGAYGLPRRAIDEFLAQVHSAERPPELRYDDPEWDAEAERVWQINRRRGDLFSVEVLRGVVQFNVTERHGDTAAGGERNGTSAAAAS